MHAAVYGQSVTSQGAYTVESHVVNSLGNNGSGIKVAIIDAGFDVTDEEISSNIAEARSFRSNGDITAGGRTAHGTATAQIVVDVAPDVELYLYNIESVPNMIRLIDYIIGRGDIDIVSLSVAWWGVGPYDGTSGLSQKVSEAQDSGILWISAAGNYADSHWEGMFADADADGFHNFGSVDETISFFAAAGSVVELELTWDDAWGRSSNDYELRLFDANLNLLISSIETQDGDDDPLETIQYLVVSDGIYNIVIERYSGEARNLELFSFEHSLTEHNVPGGSVIIPADAVGTVAVAAVGHDTESLKLYSSRGPTNDGRTKPDIAGPTDVSTSVYSSFTGTSAAAPHVAGVAALIKSANSTYTPAQIQSVLEGTTRNHHTKNNDDGTGLANAVNAMGLPLAETFETDLSAWIEEGQAGWRVGSPTEGGHPPGHHAATNTVARADGCDAECRLVLSDGLDLTGYGSAAMTLYRYVDDDLDDGEYLRVDVSADGGTSWIGAYDWRGERDDDDTWTRHTLNLAGYLDSSDFKVRLAARASVSEDVMIDTMIIDGVVSDRSAGAISDLLRIYHARPDLQAAYPEAGSGDMTGLVRWAWQYGTTDYPADPNGPHAVLGPHAHTYALLSIYDARADLQAAYPEAGSGDMTGLVRWAWQYGTTDYPADPNGPHAVLGPHAHTYALLSIYDARADLQAAYPEAGSGDMTGLVRWAWQYGTTDYPADPNGPHAVLGPHAHTYALLSIYDARADLQAAYPEVVAGDHAALTVWARDWGINDYPADPNGPHAVLGPHAHTYALLSIYDARPDLQAAYPEVVAGDHAALTVWARDWGINDYPADPNGPHAVLGPHAHTYALLSIYDARPDLQAAYPEVVAGDLAGLIKWTRDRGVTDYPLILGPYAHAYSGD